MKRMMFLGALVFGVTVCSQSFGFEVLNRILGHKSCTSCTEPGCGAGNGCADAGEPGCGAGNGCLGGCGSEPGCAAGNGCAEPACDAGNACTSCDSGCTAAPRRKHHKGSILGGLFKALHSKKACHKSCTSSCCGDACEPGCGADPGCGAGNGCSDPACGAVGVIESAPTPEASAAKKTGKVTQVSSRTVKSAK